jgi:fructosamine-3-kinase
LVTSEGPFFAKWSRSCPDDLFACEATGLEALRGAGSEVVIPGVIGWGRASDEHPAFLILEYLAPRARGDLPEEEEVLGRGLASMHRASSDRFGFGAPSYCGLTPLDNRWCDAWPEFYRDRRLGPLVKALADRGALASGDRQVFDRVLIRLPELLSGGPVPSLIHGDLWSGNVVHSARGPALVDPACAFADREMDFGISTLFGGLSARAMAAYEEAWPLPSGWRDRNGLYQLFHLLNHAVLFGGSYVSDALRVARRYAG